ncbi:hypothetical protein SLS58_009507 [Diplodia intermedia]|uniref:Uncharacterized protein n=1 Tax=Diplodia intermedia TaxID=856260 RepID=A0ABR3TBP0_9PEZI
MDELWFDAAAQHGLAAAGTPLLYEPMAADTKTTRDSWEQTPRVSRHAEAAGCCSCTAALLAALRDHAHQHHHHRRTDQLLRLNAAALNAARACLECPVPHDAPVLLLLHLAQAVVANCRVAARGADADVDVDVELGGGGGRRLSVTLGSYAVADREDGRAVARRIIALQAQKIVPVLDGLLLLLPPPPPSHERDVCYNAPARAGGGRSEDEAVRVMAGLLRAEVDGMIAALSS